MFPRSRALRAAVLVAAAGAGALAPAASGEEREGAGLPSFLAPLRVDVLAARGEATFRHSPSDFGTPGAVFDGKPGTILRTLRANPAFLEVTFDRPREVLSAQAFFPGDDPHEWSLLAGNDPERLAVLFERKRVQADSLSAVETFSPPVRARVFRVVVKGLGGEDSVRLGEVYLMARQRPVALQVQAPSSVVCPAGDLELRARVTWDGGFRSGSALGLDFHAPPDAPFRLEPGPPGPGRTVTLRYEKSGTAPVVARIHGRDSWLSSEPLLVEAKGEGLPDWSVGWIERTPRLPFDGPGGGHPEPGSAVTYRAHVKNYGTCDAPRAPVLWQLDGTTVEEGFLEGIPRFGERVATLRLDHDGRRHDLRFVVDPERTLPEVGKGNDEVTIQTDALRLGLWVERPVLEWFHRVQSSFKDGANGWEDWAQRQVRRWNRMLADAKSSLTPDGVPDRVALDLVVEAEEDALPLGGGLPSDDPDASDRTVDLQRGFPATLLDGAGYAHPGERKEDNPLWLDAAMVRELGRARGLVDLGRLDVPASEVSLLAPGDIPLAGSPWLPIVGGDCVHITRRGRAAPPGPPAGYGPVEAWALRRIAGRRARTGNRAPSPDAGEYLAELPRACGIRVLAADGKPLDGVKVRAWRRAPAADGGEVFAGEPAREGGTTDGGILDLDSGGRDPFFEGRRQGTFDPGQGVLLLELSSGGRVVYRFLEVLPFVLACAAGEKVSRFEDVPTDLPR